MFPLIDDRDLVTLAYGPLSEIHRGDVVAFVSNRGFVVHRVIKSRNKGEDILFLEKGDSSPFSTWIRGREVLGKVIEIKSDSRAIKLTSFPWKFYNRCLAFLGSLWVLVFKNNGSERGAAGKRDAFPLSKAEKRIFLFFKALSYALTNLLYRRVD